MQTREGDRETNDRVRPRRPRLGAPDGIGSRSSPAARRAACAQAACPAAEAPPSGAGAHGSGPGEVRAGHASLGPRGPYSIAAPARRQRDDEDYGAGVGFPGLVPAAAAAEVAAATGARRCRSRHAGRRDPRCAWRGGPEAPARKRGPGGSVRGARRREGAGNGLGRQQRRRRPSLLRRTLRVTSG